MKNENMPTEGQKSTKLEAESALRGAACSAFQFWWNDMDNGCPALVLDNDEDFAVAVWNAAVERVLRVLPGGQLCDPQELADMLRELIEPNSQADRTAKHW